MQGPGATQPTDTVASPTSSSTSSTSSNKSQFVFDFLSPLQLLEYQNIFLENGYDNKLSLLGLTENDLTEMKVKRGHKKPILDAITLLGGRSEALSEVKNKENAMYLVEMTNEAVQTSPNKLDAFQDATAVLFCKLFRLERALRYFKERADLCQQVGRQAVDLHVVYLDAKGFDIVYEDENITQPFDLFFSPFFDSDVKSALPKKDGATYGGRGMGIVTEMTLVEFFKKISHDQSENGVTVIDVSESQKFPVSDGLFDWSPPVKMIITRLGLNGYADDTRTCLKNNSMYLEYDAIIKVFDPAAGKEKKSSPPVSPALVGSKRFRSPPPKSNELHPPTDTKTSTSTATTSTTSSYLPNMTWSQVFPNLYEKYQKRLFRPILRQLIRKSVQN